MAKAFLKRLQRIAQKTFAGTSDYHVANSCQRKVRYSKVSAMLAAVAMEKKTGQEFDVYECDYCKGWHIGHRAMGFRVRVSLRDPGEE